MRLGKFIAFALILLVPSVSHAIIADSCSVGDIDTAIDNAADGEVVQVPAGTCNVTVSMTDNIVNNGSGLCRVTTTAAHGLDNGAYVQLASSSGASGCGGWPPVKKKITVIDNTTFDMQDTTFGGMYTTSKSITPYIVLANKSVSVVGGYGGTTYLTGYPRFSLTATEGLTKTLRVSGFDITFGAVTANHPFYVSTGTTSAFRIDNTVGTFAFGSTSVYVAVLDGSKGVIDNNTWTSPYTKVVVYGASGAVGGVTNLEWTLPVDFGTDKFTFVENNSFTNTDNTKSWAGVKTFYGGRAVARYNNFVNHTYVQHGTMGGGPLRSGRASEVYNNTFNCPYAGASGDQCSSWLEVMGGGALAYNNTIVGDWQNGFSLYIQRIGSINAGGFPWGFCDNNASHTWDGNTDPAGYVCHDQTGAGPDNTSYLPQTITEPLHYWGNTGSMTTLSAQTTHLQLDREYCTHDTSTACGGVTTTYTAYAYPHPLVGEVSSFSFTDVTGAIRSTLTTTNPCVTVAGISGTAGISISGTGCQYNVDAGAYTAVAGTVGLDNVVCMQGTSSASYSTTHPSCTLAIGGVTDSNAPWTVTTEGAAEIVVPPLPPKARVGRMRGRW